MFLTTKAKDLRADDPSNIDTVIIKHVLCPIIFVGNIKT